MCSLDWDVQIACEEERLKNFSIEQKTNMHRTKDSGFSIFSKKLNLDVWWCKMTHNDKKDAILTWKWSIILRNESELDKVHEKVSSDDDKAIL